MVLAGGGGRTYARERSEAALSFISAMLVCKIALQDGPVGEIDRVGHRESVAVAVAFVPKQRRETHQDL